MLVEHHGAVVDCYHDCTDVHEVEMVSVVVFERLASLAAEVAMDPDLSLTVAEI